MKLTKKRALQLTAIMWRIIGNKDIVKRKVIFSNKYAYGCPCCEYVSQQPGVKSSGEHGMYGSDCTDHCPMLPVWPERCEYGDSPYKMWKFDTSYRCRYAFQIAEGAQALADKEE